MPKQNEQPQPQSQEEQSPEQQERSNLLAAAEGQAPIAEDKQPRELAQVAGQLAHAAEREEELREELARLQDELTQARAEAASQYFARQREEQAAALEQIRAGRVDETVPGGRYIVGGVVVDSDNRPLPE